MTGSHHHEHTPHASAARGHGSHPQGQTAPGDHGPQTHTGGHDKHEGHDPEVFRRRFWLSLLLTIPVVVFSEMIQDWFGYSTASIPGDQFVAPILGTFVFIYGGHVFLVGAWREVRDRQPGMMLLISLAITVAFLASLATEAGWLDLDFWWELAALVTVMLLGHWLEMRALGMTRGALAALADLIPDDAERVTDDGTERVPVAALTIGDVVLVRPGGRVPADGAVASGQADFDESMLTGESRPVLRAEGERVAAGTVALGSAVRVRIDAVGEGTTLAGIQRLVAQAQQSQSRAQAIADRAAVVLFYVALAAGAATIATWLLLGEGDQAIARTVTVLVIACPHALGLAIPLVIAISTEVSARNGILVKDRLALERTRLLDVVLFDKTGTLTVGRPQVTGVWAADGDEDGLLRLAGSVEAESEHPLARAIVNRARERVTLEPVIGFAADAGRGVRGVIAGDTVEVAGPRRLRETGLDLPPAAEGELGPWRGRGATVLYVLRAGSLAGALALEDEARPESRQAVEELHRLGVRVAMVTGDAATVAEAVARDLGIDDVFAEVLPEHKAEQVRALQARGLRVAMVGDGVNDAPALAEATVGIAMGQGTDVALETADVTLMTSDLSRLVEVLAISQRCYGVIMFNFWGTILVDTAGIVLAFFGQLSPIAAALIHVGSELTFILNSARLFRQRAVNEMRTTNTRRLL